ncbi:hypothetical protein CRENBAI_008206 [Crenichthys baileyi]|uniref:BEN domain-containing protein n=1 Tax=Crenichthys baileyi TaxID=28760 RepID=A0AAV9SL05_9TELE
MSTPSMVSNFDQRELEDQVAPAGQVVEEPGTSSEDQVCCSVACSDLLKSYKSELDKLAKIRVDLEARVEQQQHTITTYKRLVASLRRRLAEDRGGGGIHQHPFGAPFQWRITGENVIFEALVSGEVTEEQNPTTLDAPSSLPTPKEGTQILSVEDKIVSPNEATQPVKESEEAGPSFTWSAGTRKGNVMRRILLAESMALYLKQFAEFQTSTQATPKMLEAAKSRVSEMGQSGKEITTLRFYIHHAYQFIEYMVNSCPQQCRMTREQMNEILVYLEKARKDTRRPIMVHQNRVKRAKMARIPDSASILKCSS